MPILAPRGSSRCPRIAATRALCTVTGLARDPRRHSSRPSFDASESRPGIVVNVRRWIGRQARAIDLGGLHQEGPDAAGSYHVQLS